MKVTVSCYNLQEHVFRRVFTKSIGFNYTDGVLTLFLFDPLYKDIDISCTSFTVVVSEVSNEN